MGRTVFTTFLHWEGIRLACAKHSSLIASDAMTGGISNFIELESYLHIRRQSVLLSLSSQ